MIKIYIFNIFLANWHAVPHHKPTWSVGTRVGPLVPFAQITTSLSHNNYNGNDDIHMYEYTVIYIYMLIYNMFTDLHPKTAIKLSKTPRNHPFFGAFLHGDPPSPSRRILRSIPSRSAAPIRRPRRRRRLRRRRWRFRPRRRRGAAGRCVLGAALGGVCGGFSWILSYTLWILLTWLWKLAHS